MIKAAMAIVVLVPIGILVLLVQDERRAQQGRPPMGWLRRWWAGPPRDRRHCHRYRVTIPLTYRIVPPGEASQRALMRDIGFGGIGIMVQEKLIPGTLLELNLHRDPPEGPIAIRGAVKWIREIPRENDPRRVFWAGIQITHTGIASTDQLQALLQQISPDGQRNRV